MKKEILTMILNNSLFRAGVTVCSHMVAKPSKVDLLKKINKNSFIQLVLLLMFSKRALFFKEFL